MMGVLTMLAQLPPMPSGESASSIGPLCRCARDSGVWSEERGRSRGADGFSWTWSSLPPV